MDLTRELASKRSTVVDTSCCLDCDLCLTFYYGDDTKLIHVVR